MNNAHLLERRAAFAFAQFIKPRNAPSISTSRAIWTNTARPALKNMSSQTPKRLKTLPTCPRKPNNARSRWNSTNSKQSPDPTPNLGSPEPAPSLSQRLKKLSREYGWTAVGVYLALSALDFPFCFLAVRALGTERIGQWEHNVVQWVKGVIAIPFPGLIKDTGESSSESVEAVEAAVREGNAALDDQLQRASKDSNASTWQYQIAESVQLLTQ